MIEESLQIYRQERKRFIQAIKYNYGIDYYDLDIKERKEWLLLFIKSKREFNEKFFMYSGKNL